jgi:membrane peptidoglycan carboxypeptidase
MAMATQLSLCDIMGDAAQLGVVQADPTQGATATNDAEIDQPLAVPFGTYPANVLGTDSTTPLAMAGAFAAFAADGMYCTPIAITSVVAADGRTLPIPDAACTQAIKPDVAQAMTTVLSAVWDGTMKAVGSPGLGAAGTSGVSNNNEHTWFVGYTGELSAAVLVAGSPTEFVSLNDKTIGGTPYGTVFASDIAGPTWKRFIEAVLGGDPAPPSQTP